MKGYKTTEIGLIPEEWGVKSLGDYCDVYSGYAFKKEDFKKDGVPVVKIGELQNGRILLSRNTDYVDKKLLKEDKVQRHILKAGDLLIAMTGATTGKTARVAKDYQECLLNQRVGKFVLINDDMEYDFIECIIRTKTAQEQIGNSILKSAQGNISPTGIKNIHIPFPSLVEQKTIFCILSKIQSFIETQEKIIKTTTELKKALMQKLFTEGLYGESQKITEIGKIPKSWEAVEISKLVKETSTRNPEKEPLKIIKYVDVSSVSNETFSIMGHQVFSGKDAPGRARKVVYVNDVIFATVRPTLKRVAKVGSKYNNEYCSTAYCVLRTDEQRLDYEFLYQYLLTDSFIKEIGKLQKGVSYPAVRDDDVRGMKIPIPSIKEQNGISKALKQLDEKMLITLKRKDCLQSLFKSMLHQLMTGQIRVKDWKIA